MSRDARSSPISDLDDANFLDGTEMIAVEQYLDPTHPEIGKRDVKIPLSAIVGGGGVFGDVILWQSQTVTSPPVFTARTPPPATVGVAYSYTFDASGSPASTFTVTSGSLPAGLNLASSGVLSGIPTTAATSNFVVTATNGIAPDAVTPTITMVTGVGPPVPPTLAWYDPSDILAITQSGGFVTLLVDKIGNVSSNHDLGSSGANRPSLSTINGRQSLAFAAGNVMNSAAFSHGQPLTVFLVVQPTAATITAASGSVNAEVLGTSTGTTPAVYAVPPTTYWSAFNGAALSSTTALDTDPHILCVVFNGASSLIELDGASIATGSLGTGGFIAGNLALGADSSSLTPWLGKIGEIIYYTSALSPSDRVSVLSYLTAKWGTTNAPTFINFDPPDATVGLAYSYTFTTSGSPASTFSVTSGSLPAGLALAADGVLSGTPTTGATSNFVVTATNGVSPDAVTPTVTIVTTAGPPVAPTLSWFDPSDTASVTVVSGNVTAMADKSGHGNDLVNQFTPGITTINALQAIDYNHGGLSALYSNTLVQPQPITSFAVVQASASTMTSLLADLAVVLAFNGGTVGHPSPGLFADVTTTFWAMADETHLVSTTVADTTAHVLTGVYNGGSSTLYLDGALIATGDAGSGGFDSLGFARIILGAEPAVPGPGLASPWLGVIGEVLQYTSALSAPDRASIEAYLKAKWNTP